MKKIQQYGAALAAAVWLCLAVLAWVYPVQAESTAERRALAQKPALTLGSVLDGSFMARFETGAQDQFPFREGFRAVKAAASYGVFRQGDNNGIYLSQGHAAKLEYPYQESAGDRAVKLLRTVYETYFAGQGGKAVFAVVPDKGYYLAAPGGYPAMDYDALFEKMKGQDWAEFVDLTDCLTADSYYKTDTHWRQEALLPAAEKLAQALGITLSESYTPVALETPFYGVYRGQAALPLKADTLVMMTSPVLENCRVTNYETGKTGTVYDLTKLDSRDLYDVYLSGAVSLLEITNPAGPEDKTLVVFRDSFGSSLVPLLAEGYGRVILVDLRYMPGSILSEYVDISGADVLFLYSTLVLNNSTLLRW